MLLRKTRSSVIAATIIICQLAIVPAQITPTDLVIKKISKVMRDDDPTGRNHNTKVVIAPHPPLRDVVEWKLILETTDGGTETLSIKVDGMRPTTQTEFIFEGNLPDSKSIFLQAKNRQEVVAKDYIGLPITDLHSSVAWVGDDKDSLLSSLRVDPGKLAENVLVEGHTNCSSAERPCYYLNPNPKPTVVERCIEGFLGASKTVNLCDEREIPYQEMSQRPSLYLRGDGTIELKILKDKGNFTLEIVAYDPDNTSNIFSNSSYRCYIPLGQDQNTDGTLTCLHSISLPEGQKEIMMLVVQMDLDGYVLASILQIFRGNLPEVDSASIFVAAFMGTLGGLAILILLGMYFVKRKQTKTRKKREAYKETQTKYTRTASSDSTNQDSYID